MVQVEFVATADDLRAFQQFAVTKVRGFTTRASLGGLSWRSITLGVPVGIVLVILTKISTFEFHAPTALLCAAIFVSLWLFFRWRSLRAFPPDAEGSCLGPRRTRLDDAGIRERSAHSDHHTDWQGVLSVEETEQHVFVMIDRFAGYIIPKRAFADVTDLQEFLRFTRQHATVDRHGHAAS
jgi:hypothetical protein